MCRVSWWTSGLYTFDAFQSIAVDAQVVPFVTRERRMSKMGSCRKSVQWNWSQTSVAERCTQNPAGSKCYMDLCILCVCVCVCFWQSLCLLAPHILNLWSLLDCVCMCMCLYRNGKRDWVWGQFNMIQNITKHCVAGFQRPKKTTDFNLLREN